MDNTMNKAQPPLLRKRNTPNGHEPNLRPILIRFTVPLR